MKKHLAEIRKQFRALREDEGGATMIEYSVLIALITVLLILTIQLVGEHIETAWVTLEQTLAGAGEG